MQGRNLSGIDDIDDLDVEPPVGLAGEDVQSGPGLLARGGDHAPAALQIFFHDRQPQAARRAEQQKTLFRF